MRKRHLPALFAIIKKEKKKKQEQKKQLRIVMDKAFGIEVIWSHTVKLIQSYYQGRNYALQS